MSLFDVRNARRHRSFLLGTRPSRRRIFVTLMTPSEPIIARRRNKSMEFSWTDSSMVDRLFTQPDCDSCSDLARHLKTFVRAAYFWRRGRVRAWTVTRAVEHLWCGGSLHRILPEVKQHIADQNQDRRQVSATMLSAMAESVATVNKSRH